MSDTKQKAPTWFWVVSGLCLLWSLGGIMAYMSHVMLTPEALAAMPEAERALIENTPAWATGAFAIGVFAETLGCLLLLLRKGLAFPVLIVSLAAVVVQMSHALLMTDLLKVHGPSALALPCMIIIIGIFLVWFSFMAKGKEWIA